MLFCSMMHVASGVFAWVFLRIAWVFLRISSSTPQTLPHYPTSAAGEVSQPRQFSVSN